MTSNAFNETFDKLQRAQKALESVKVPRKEKQTDATQVLPVSGRVVVNGIEVASRDEMLDEMRTLRDDLNEVLDNFDGGGKRVIEVKVNDVQVSEIEGAVHEKFDTLLKLSSVRDGKGYRKNIWMTGETGSGKSTGAKQVADALRLDFYTTGKVDMAFQIEGSVNQVSGAYMSKPFVQAFENGGAWVGEEVDSWSPNAVMATQTALANGWMMRPDGKLIERHPDFLCIMCANTWGSGATAEYVGRNKLDAAFLDRFAYRLNWGYDEAMERRIAGDDEVVDLVQAARWNAKQEGIKVIISPRSSIDIADLVAHGFDLREACELNFLAGLERSVKSRLLANTELG